MVNIVYADNLKQTGSILRIATRELVDSVFDRAIYYTKMKRSWNQGHVIVFVSKTQEGDAFVGYGIVHAVSSKDDLCAEEQDECRRGGWEYAIEFKYVKRFVKPLLTKHTFFKDTNVRGRCFHGFRLSSEQVKMLLSLRDSGFTKTF